MPLTPRSYADFKECLGNFKSDLVDFKEGLTDLADFKSDLIELIKLPYTDIIDINYPFFINDRVFIGYGFSLKDDIDIICDQIYKKEKSSALLNSIKKTILDFKKDTTKSDYENSILLYERINKATNDLKRLPSLSEPTKSISSSLLKNQSSLNNKTSNNEIINKEINNNKTNNTLPEFKFILDSQKDAILEQKLKPLITQINKKLSGSPLGNLQDITLSTNKSSINKTTPYNSKTTLLNNTHSTDKTTIPTNQSSTPKIYKEHIALLAFLYLSDTRELSPSLITYIKSKNRFRAWYFLAYESFEGKDEFINIRDRISSKFGLYEYDEYNNILDSQSKSFNNQSISNNQSMSLKDKTTSFKSFNSPFTSFKDLNNQSISFNNQTTNTLNLSLSKMEHISFSECIDVFSHLNITKIRYTKKDKENIDNKNKETDQKNNKDKEIQTDKEEATCLEFIRVYEANIKKLSKVNKGLSNFNAAPLNKKSNLQNLNPQTQILQDESSSIIKDEISTPLKHEILLKPFMYKLNSLLSSHIGHNTSPNTSKTFDLKNIYCINITHTGISNTSRINKLLRKKEEELYKEQNILILCPIKTATPIRIFQPKKSNFTIVLASQTPFDCAELNPDKAKQNSCQLILTDFIFNPYTNQSSLTEDIKFKNVKTKSNYLDPLTGEFNKSDIITLYQGEDKSNDEDKDDKNNKEDKNKDSNSDKKHLNNKTKPNAPYFSSIRQDKDDIEYRLKDGMIQMSCFKQSNNSDLKHKDKSQSSSLPLDKTITSNSNLKQSLDKTTTNGFNSNQTNTNTNSDQTNSNKSNYLNFTLLNFAKENNFTLRDDKPSSMFDMRLQLAYANKAISTSYSNSDLELSIKELIIEDEKGKATNIDKVYLHNCDDKIVYKSSSLEKNKDSLFKNSYTAIFNIPIDKKSKKDTKLIIYSSDLSKSHTTKDMHQRSDTAIVSLSYKDKNNQSLCYKRKVSLRDITDNIINVISDNEYPFKTNEEITLKAIYKQEQIDIQTNTINQKYKDVLWGYRVIRTTEYNKLLKSDPKEVTLIKDKRGKEITFKISDIIKKDDLDKLKQSAHSIVFFATLEEKDNKTDKTKQTNETKDINQSNKTKFHFNTRYGKTHIRIDINKEYEEENKENENYNVLRIETKDGSGDYIEILVHKEEILFNIEDEDLPLDNDFLVSFGIIRFVQKSVPKIIKYAKDIKFTIISLTRAEIMEIFKRLEKGDDFFIRLVEDKKELNLLWIRISKGSKFVEKRTVNITNKKTKITTKEDIAIHKLDDDKTIIKYRTGSSAGGETIEMDAVKKVTDKIGNISDGQWKVHIKRWEP